MNQQARNQTFEQLQTEAGQRVALDLANKLFEENDLFRRFCTDVVSSMIRDGMIPSGMDPRVSLALRGRSDGEMLCVPVLRLFMVMQGARWIVPKVRPN